LERVGCYANARDLLGKGQDELAELQCHGLGIVYLGLESGDDDVLQRIDKGATVAEMVQAVQLARAAGLKTSVIGILGIAGPEGSAQHAQATGEVVSAMDPHYFSMLTLMLVPGTPLYRQWRAGEFCLLEPKAMLLELRQVIHHLKGLGNCVFRTNHASNYLPLAGTLPQDQARLLAMLDGALDTGDAALRPEAWRAL
jgi:histone acetyltransferase (RNA polymerase elongator complex component)